jgi:hypothetical protein
VLQGCVLDSTRRARGSTDTAHRRDTSYASKGLVTGGSLLDSTAKLTHRRKMTSVSSRRLCRGTTIPGYTAVCGATYQNGAPRQDPGGAATPIAWLG